MVIGTVNWKTFLILLRELSPLHAQVCHLSHQFSSQFLSTTFALVIKIGNIDHISSKSSKALPVAFGQT